MCFRNEQCISLTKARPYQRRIWKSFCGGGAKFSKGSGESTGDRFRSPAGPGQSPCRGVGGAEKPPVHVADGFSVLLKLLQPQLWSILKMWWILFNQWFFSKMYHSHMGKDKNLLEIQTFSSEFHLVGLNIFYWIFYQRDWAHVLNLISPSPYTYLDKINISYNMQ